MKDREFTIIQARPEESEDDANAWSEAGCEDGSIRTSNGVTRTCSAREHKAPGSFLSPAELVLDQLK